MTLAQHFHAAMTQAFRAGTAELELLPTLLCRACVRVLPVDGAGVSMTDILRVPLGASDEIVARAERLQTTLGEGPCLTAAGHQEPLVADLHTMAARWPMFHQELSEQTPYRSVASVPLRLPDASILGALDLYSIDIETLDPDTIAAVATDIADPMAAIIFGFPITDDGNSFTAPGWLAAYTVTNRMNVWVAIGLIVEQHSLSNADALAALRGYAFSHHTTLDDVAAELTNNKLQPDDLIPPRTGHPGDPPR